MTSDETAAQGPSIHSIEVIDNASNGTGSSESRYRAKVRRRPGKGIFTFAMILLTIFGIIMCFSRITRRFTLLFYLPVYVVLMAGYVMFLCCVKNKYEMDDEDDYNPRPAVLTQHLECKTKGCEHCDKANNPETVDKTFTLDESFHDNGITIAETLTDETDIGEMSSASDEHEVAAFFSKTFPGLSKTFEEFETWFHKSSKQLRRQSILQPQQCYNCTDGADLSGSSSCAAGIPEDFVDIDLSTSSTHITRNKKKSEVDRMIDADEEIGIEDRVNLTGKYKLVHNHKFEEFLKSQNIGAILRKAANAARPVHTYTHNGNTLRVQIDGIVKGDSTFIIDGPHGHSNIRHHKFHDHVTWADGGKAVQVRKVCQNPPKNGANVMIVKRTLSNNGHNLMIFSRGIFPDGSECETCIQTFHRMT